MRQEMNEMRETMSAIQATLLTLQRPSTSDERPSHTASNDHPQPSTSATTTGMSQDLQVFQPSQRPIVTTGIPIAAHVKVPMKEQKAKCFSADDDTHTHEHIMQGLKKVSVVILTQ